MCVCVCGAGGEGSIFDIIGYMMEQIVYNHIYFFKKNILFYYFILLLYFLFFSPFYLFSSHTHTGSPHVGMERCIGGFKKSF